MRKLFNKLRKRFILTIEQEIYISNIIKEYKNVINYKLFNLDIFIKSTLFIAIVISIIIFFFIYSNPIQITYFTILVSLLLCYIMILAVLITLNLTKLKYDYSKYDIEMIIIREVYNRLFLIFLSIIFITLSLIKFII